MQDIDLLALKTKAKGKARTSQGTKAQVVKAKYISPNGLDRWSGRGRAPTWVNDLCLQEGIGLEEFKKDDQFRL